MYVITSSTLKRATTHLAKGNYCSFAMKIPRLKKEVIKVVAAEVRRECQALCSTLSGKKSVLHRTSAADLKTFQFSKVVSEHQRLVPFWRHLRCDTESSTPGCNISINWVRCYCVASWKKQLSVNSILFHPQKWYVELCALLMSFRRTTVVIQLYNQAKCMGVCLSHRSTLNARKWFR